MFGKPWQGILQLGRGAGTTQHECLILGEASTTPNIFSFKWSTVPAGSFQVRFCLAESITHGLSQKCYGRIRSLRQWEWAARWSLSLFLGAGKFLLHQNHFACCICQVLFERKGMGAWLWWISFEGWGGFVGKNLAYVYSSLSSRRHLGMHVQAMPGLFSLRQFPPLARTFSCWGVIVLTVREWLCAFHAELRLMSAAKRPYLSAQRSATSTIMPSPGCGWPGLALNATWNI